MIEPQTEKAGYHLRSIPKGEYGTIEKIIEEYEEYLDACEQECAIMAVMELSDIYGAVKGFLDKATHQEKETHKWFLQGVTKVMVRDAAYFGFELTDLIVMSNITERAFKNGIRK